MKMSDQQEPKITCINNNQGIRGTTVPGSKQNLQNDLVAIQFVIKTANQLLCEPRC